MGGMPMPGAWTMSMTWMRMPDQTWPAAAASFVTMWIVMMTAMMLPSLVPMLSRYRELVDETNEKRLARLTTLAGLSYFFVWALLGMVAYPLGVGAATIEMKVPAFARTVPILAGFVVVAGGTLQFTKWKAYHLACCRGALARDLILAADAGTAWCHGLRLGLHCICCCSGLTTVLLVSGVMDFRAMLVVTAATTCERLAPAGEAVARTIGILVIGAGLCLIARVVLLG